jgi:hypothetical protein
MCSRDQMRFVICLAPAILLRHNSFVSNAYPERFTAPSSPLWQTNFYTWEPLYVIMTVKGCRKRNLRDLGKAIAKATFK